MCTNGINFQYSSNCALTCSKEIEAGKVYVMGREFYIIAFSYDINSNIDTLVLFLVSFILLLWYILYLSYKLKNFITLVKSNWLLD